MTSLRDAVGVRLIRFGNTNTITNKVPKRVCGFMETWNSVQVRAVLHYTGDHCRTCSVFFAVVRPRKY